MTIGARGVRTLFAYNYHIRIYYLYIINSIRYRGAHCYIMLRFINCSFDLFITRGKGKVIYG